MTGRPTGTGALGRRALGWSPRKMFRHTDQWIADQPIVGVGSVRSQSIQPLRQCQSHAMPTVADVKGQQAPERSQLVLGIVKALRDLEGLCPGRAGLGNVTSGMHQRRAECGMELHLAARVPSRSCPQSGERRSTRSRHSSASEKCIHSGTAAAVSALREAPG
jgi:predicted RNA-binding Zn-ribbon protein involved in translation (DUF1610 family)